MTANWRLRATSSHIPAAFGARGVSPPRTEGGVNAATTCSEIHFPLAPLLLVAVLVGGCFVSAGPTIGYQTRGGFTLGGEVTSGYYKFIHGGGGFHGREARDKGKDDSTVAAFYGFIGPGAYGPFLSDEIMTETALGLGVMGDRENGASPLLRVWGGPSYVGNMGLVGNIFLGVSFWNGGWWFHLTPQVGLFTIPGLGDVNL